MSTYESYWENFEDNLVWIRRIWAQRVRARKEPTKYEQTDFWICVRGTIVLLLDLTFEPSKNDPDYGIPNECEVIAANTLGIASWEYGGTAWEYLACRGFRYFIGSDSSA